MGSVVAAQLVGSNPVICIFYLLSTTVLNLFWKDENKGKRGKDCPFKNKTKVFNKEVKLEQYEQAYKRLATCRVVDSDTDRYLVLQFESGHW